MRLRLLLPLAAALAAAPCFAQSATSSGGTPVLGGTTVIPAPSAGTAALPGNLSGTATNSAGTAVQQTSAQAQSVIGPNVYPALQQVAGAPQSNNILNYAWMHYDPFGDSIDQGVDTTSCTSPYSVGTTTCYVGLNALSMGLGSATTNHGVAGTATAEIQAAVFNSINNDTSTMDAVTIKAGTNDVGGCAGQVQSVLSPCESVFSSLYQAMEEWASVAASNKQTVSSYATNWSADTTYSKVTGAQSYTNGAVQAFPTQTLPLGDESPVFWYRVFNSSVGNNCSFNWQYIRNSDSAQLLAGTISTVTTANPLKSPVSNLTSAVYSVMLPGGVNGFAAEANHFVFTVTSPTNVNNVCSILATGFAPSYYYSNGTTNQPQIWVNSIPLESNNAYAAGTAEFNYLIQKVLQTDQQAGFPINYVNMANCLTGVEADYYPGNDVHPGDSGHAKLHACEIQNTYKVPVTPFASIPVTSVQGPSATVTGPIKFAGNNVSQSGNVFTFGASTNPPLISQVGGDTVCAMAADSTVGAQTPTSGSSTSSTMTYTFSQLFPYFYPGQIVQAQGFTPSGFNGGPLTVLSTSGYSVTVSSTNNPGTMTGFGTLSLYCSNQSTDQTSTSSTSAFALNTAALSAGYFAAAQPVAAEFQSSMDLFGPASSSPPSVQFGLFNGTSTVYLTYGVASLPVSSALAGRPSSVTFNLSGITSTLANFDLKSWNIPTPTANNWFTASVAQPTIVSTSASTLAFGISFSKTGVMSISPTAITGCTVTGTSGQTVLLTGFNNSSTATATVTLSASVTAGALSSSNVGSVTITARGQGNGAAPTTATCSAGTASSASGTATFTSVLGGAPGWGATQRQITLR